MTQSEIKKVRNYIREAKRLGFEGIEILIPLDMLSKEETSLLKESFSDLGVVSVTKEKLPAVNGKYIKTEKKDIGCLCVSWTNKILKQYQANSITSLDYILTHEPEENTVLVNIDIDEDIKEQAEKLFKEYGLTLEEGINMFLRWCVDNPEDAKKYLQS